MFGCGRALRRRRKAAVAVGAGFSVTARWHGLTRLVLGRQKSAPKLRQTGGILGHFVLSILFNNV